jgi:hypothetical protein
MHPQPVRGGCPAATDKRNADLYVAGFFGPDVKAPPRSERDHIAELAARFAASSASSPAQREAPRDRSGGYVDECGSCGMASCSC